MKIVLLERMPNLGQVGDTVTVKNGYARNFLLPQKKALRATKENLKFFEEQRAELEADNFQRAQEAQAVADRLLGRSVSLIRQASDTGSLYGSVKVRDIAAAILEQLNIKVSSKQLSLSKPIRALGIHLVEIALHSDVIKELSVIVAKTPEEAAAQSQKLLDKYEAKLQQTRETSQEPTPSVEAAGEDEKHEESN